MLPSWGCNWIAILPLSCLVQEKKWQNRGYGSSQLISWCGWNLAYFEVWSRTLSSLNFIAVRWLRPKLLKGELWTLKMDLSFTKHHWRAVLYARWLRSFRRNFKRWYLFLNYTIFYCRTQGLIEALRRFRRRFSLVRNNVFASQVPENTLRKTVLCNTVGHKGKINF